MICENILQSIGNTPLVLINHLNPNPDVQIYAKIEGANPTGSIKDRIALKMIEQAEAEGHLKQGKIIIEPTSGNTGIGLALVAAVKGYRLILTMPESMSIERRKILKMFGAEIVLTNAVEGMAGAVKKAEELLRKYKNSFMPQQFKNKANPEIHRKVTANEIWTDSGGNVDILVAGVGTGGTLTGCGEALKVKNPNLKVYAVEPEGSPVLSGGNAGAHKIQGIGAGFVPDVLNMEIIDEIIKVSNENAINTAREMASKEGILVGISSGANVWAAIEVSKMPENRGKTIVTFGCDTGERYISTEMYEGY